MKRGAIFDMDGLLFDTERIYQENWLLTAREYGFEPHPDFPRAICGTCGAHTREVIRSFYPSVDAEEFLQSCLRRVLRQQEEGIEEKPGVREILAFFQSRGIRLAVASSSALAQIEKNLSRAGLRPCFDAVVSGDQVKRASRSRISFWKPPAVLTCRRRTAMCLKTGSTAFWPGREPAALPS